MTRRDQDRGFTLLEVLIALAIAALALGVLFHGTMEGLAATQAAGQYEEALERARSHLAALADRGTLAPVDDTGDDGGGYRWRHRVAAVATEVSVPGAPRPNQAAGPPITLYAVSVAITWSADGRERGVTLATERVALDARTDP